MEHQVVKAKQAIVAFIGRLGNGPAKTFLKKYTPSIALHARHDCCGSFDGSSLKTVGKVNRLAGRLIENDYNSPYDKLLSLR